MNVGAFVCSCADTCAIDLEAVREGVDDVDLVASSRLLCEDGLGAMDRLIDEYDLDQLIVTTPEPRCQSRFEDLATEKGLHPDATAFVDQREGAGWVHEEPAATEKTARLINATRTGLAYEASTRSVSREAGSEVAVIGDAETAAGLSDIADVTLVANGQEFANSEFDLDDVTVERGRVVSVDGRYGEFEVALEAGVTDDCVSCMKCVKEGPDDAVTHYPVDIAPGTEGGRWAENCPTDAIVLEGTHRALEFDQVIHPGAESRARGGQLGCYTHVDAGTIAAVESLLGGVRKPKFLDFDMEVCAAGESSQEGCTACVEACPHEAVERPRIDEVAFDEISCQNCGACTSSCPTGAVQLREPSNERLAREVEALLEVPDRGGLLRRRKPAIDPQVIAFVCSEHAARRLREYGRQAAGGDGDGGEGYHPILPVRVNCTDTVGEAHAMGALAAGADGVTIVGCGDRCLHSGPDPKAELVKRLNTATGDLGLGKRVSFLAPGESAREFAAELDAFVSGLGESPIPVGHTATGGIDAERENPAFSSHGWTLESIRVILEHTDPEREVIRGLEDFGRMEVSDDACTLTPTCANLCPTDAIRRTDTKLQFNHERCVNCGLCEEGCPETAITMRDGLDLALLPENREEVVASENGAGDGSDADPAWVTMIEGEMRECVRCGKPFTSERTAAKIESEVGDLVTGVAPEAEHTVFAYCGDCRVNLLFESGPGTTPGDGGVGPGGN